MGVQHPNSLPYPVALLPKAEPVRCLAISALRCAVVSTPWIFGALTAEHSRTQAALDRVHGSLVRSNSMASLSRAARR